MIDIFILEMLTTIVLGLVEGITEWLPISSTGHMILVNALIGDTARFTNSDLYLYVIQLGAILAVVTLYFRKLNPFSPSKTKREKQETWQMWFKVIIACLPAAVIGLLLDDYMEAIENWYVVAAMLIIYGIAFIAVENTRRKTKINGMSEMTYKTALMIGLFQVLSIIPRETAAEFSFFLAIPVMFGVSILKIAKNGLMMTGNEWIILITGMVVAYVVSMIAIKFLMNYVRSHDFKAFGRYRIVLGIIVIAFFSAKAIFGF